MRCVPLALALAATLLSSRIISAQSVDDIVARNIAAKGGYDLLKGTTTVRTTARGTMRGEPVTTVTLSKRPSMMRNEITRGTPAGGSTAGLQGGPRKLVYGFDGTTAWVQPDDGRAQPIPPGPQTDAQKTASQIDPPLLDYKARGTTITLGEPLREGGRRLHHLIVTPRGAPPMHYYIDPDTGLETRMVMTVEERGQVVRMEMRFDDYRDVAGRMVPFSVTHLVNGTPYMQLTFETIEFDVPLDEALFRMPGGGFAPSRERAPRTGRRW